MRADQNLAVHSAWAEAENRHDLSRHHEFLRDDIVVHQSGQEPVVGFDAYMTMMDKLYSALDGFSTTLEDQFATDDRVVCRWESTGIHSGDMNGIPATGRRLTFAGVSLWEFEDGKARRGFIFPDIAALMSQLMCAAGRERPDRGRRVLHELHVPVGTVQAVGSTPPSIFEWAGGRDAFARWLNRFYDLIEQEAPEIAAMFGGRVSDHHRSAVTDWWSEVMGGPAVYTEQRGGYEHMLARHENLSVTASQRLAFVTLLSRAADDVGLPADPEFRAALMGYAEWGTRLAMHNSQPGARVAAHAPVPRWGWGVAPPYRPENT